MLAVDLRGYGETAAGVVKDGKAPTFGVEFKESFLAFHLNRPLLGQRTADLLGVINTVAEGDRASNSSASVPPARSCCTPRC